MDCGGCSACCESSYFIHVRPEETDALAHIPAELLFPAPDLPTGNVLLGYDKKGRCPMLGDGRCSVYGHRPLTCRTYDCRIFAAAGMAADRALITESSRRWRFSYPTEHDRVQHEAVRAAARFLQHHAECFPGGVLPASPVQVAILAVKVFEVFLRPDGQAGAPRLPASEAEIVAAGVKASEGFKG